MASTSSSCFSSLNSELISLPVVCSIRGTFTVKAPSNATLRDIYLEVSMETSQSKSVFKLNTEHKQLPDILLLLPEYDVKNGTKIYLNVHIQSGLIGNIDNLTPARQATRSYVFEMCPQDVKDFFEAKHTVCVKIPVGRNAIGSLKFSLDEPLNQEPEFYAESPEQISDFGPAHFFHSLSKIATKDCVENSRATCRQMSLTAAESVAGLSTL